MPAGLAVCSDIGVGRCDGRQPTGGAALGLLGRPTRGRAGHWKPLGAEGTEAGAAGRTEHREGAVGSGGWLEPQ